MNTWIRQDATAETVARAFDRVRAAIYQRIKEEVPILARRAGARIGKINEKRLGKSLRRVMAVDPFRFEPWLAPLSESWVRENVSLIRSVAEEYLGEVERIILRQVREGGDMGETMKTLMERFGVSQSRAELIARDQATKFHGRLTQERQQRLGIQMYRWINSGDERVRGNPSGKYPKAVPSHWVMQGKLCRWDDPAVYSRDGGKTWAERTVQMPKEHPGQPIQCRCWAEPVLPR